MPAGCRRSVRLLPALLFFMACPGFAASPDNAYSVFQSMLNRPVAFDAPPAVMELAKKKKGKKGKQQRNKKVKIDARSKRTIELGGSRAREKSQLGQSGRQNLRQLGQSSADENWYRNEQQRLSVEQLNAGKVRADRDRSMLEGLKKRLFYGEDVNRQGAGGRTLLHEAVAGGHRSSVRYLLENGADRNIKDASGMTPLGLAKLMKQPDLLTLFQ
ncbi:MAG: ankyrin repeat domain-containing protein [Verrucomicrobiota bacterium]